MSAGETLKLELWHGSDDVFKWPDYEVATALRNERGQRHANGGMGLWTSIKRPPAGQYGKNMYRVLCQVPASAKRAITVTELRDISNRYANSPAKFRGYRKSLMDLGVRILYLYEEDGKAQQAIIVDYSTILEFALCN